MSTLKLLLFFIISFLFFDSSAQVSFLHDESWEEIKGLSSKSGKPIFIDFYTTWCGPCKMMDKTTFLDSTVSEILNDQFICVKLDAEKEINKEVVKLFGINSYPTFVFSNENGEVLLKEKGYSLPKEFHAICRDLLSFLNDDLSSKMTVGNSDDLSKEELERIYSAYTNFNFGAKPEIKKKCYDRLELDEEISTNAFKFLLTNFESNDKYHLLIDKIPDVLTIQEHVKLNGEFSRIFNLLFDEASLKGDMVAFKEISQNYKRAYNKTKKERLNIALNEPSKEIRTRRLSFYLENKNYNEYFVLADSLINEYILPLNSEQIRFSDKLLSDGGKHVMEQLGEIDKKEPKVLSIRDKLLNKNQQAFKLSYRLVGISENILKYVDDKEKLHKSLEWTELSITYIDLPESRIIKAAILNKLGKNQESETELIIAKNSPYFDKMCEKKIAKLNL